MTYLYKLVIKVDLWRLMTRENAHDMVLNEEKRNTEPYLVLIELPAVMECLHLSLWGSLPVCTP